MLDAFKYLTFLWLTFCLFFCINRIVSKNLKSIYFVFVTFYIFFALPLLLDLLLGLPYYSGQPGFQISQNDFNTNVIYLIYISVIPILWLGASRSVKTIHDFPPLNYNLMIIFTLYLTIASPLFLLLFFPESRNQLNYGLVAADGIETGTANIVNTVTFLSVFASLILFLSQRNLILSLFFLTPFPFLAIWLNGKRTIVLILVIGLITAFIYRGFLNGLRSISVTILLLTVFIGFSNLYQLKVRDLGKSNQTLEQRYTNIRIDYGRDDVTKMTIFAELNPSEIKILEYRGQSFLFTLLPFIPRNLWAEKPQPYAQYFTSAMLLQPPQTWGWGMTTSLLEEGIANFSWLGMFISPLFILLICTYGDRLQNLLMSLSTVLITSLLLAVQVAAFYPVIVIYFLFLIILNKKLSRSKIGVTRKYAISHSS